MKRMRRRDFVKALMAAPMAAKAVLSGTPAIAQQPVNGEDHPRTAAPGAKAPAETSSRHFDYRTQQLKASVVDAAGVTESHFLTAAELATLTKLAEIFVPATNGYPSAVQAGAVEFLDFLLSESPTDKKQLYQNGLTRLNADAHKQFNAAFADVNATQADKLIRPWLRSWMPDHPPTEPYAKFINLAHHELRTATQNSRAWSVAATASGERTPGVGDYWKPIDPFIEKYA
jgi:hypothetical protein